MAQAPEKITLSGSRDIPFNKLVLSQSNVRRLKAGVSVEDLAEDIARRTLLQSLNVRPILDAGGAETGMYEVPAGGRRYRALALLVKQKRLAKTALVPCLVRDPRASVSANEDSLAENVHRAELHPLDQFDAFVALTHEGQGEEEIAARFFVTPAIVRQRLKLASVSPKLRQAYADGAMSLEQLMALTVSDDHKRQERVWKSIEQSWNKEPHAIRRLMTEGAVAASDKRAQFVGLETYEAAGGVIARDLFEQDSGGWLQDAALLESLAAEKLKREAEAIAAEGWKWVEAQISFPFGHTTGLRALAGESPPLIAAEEAAKVALEAEYDRIEAEYTDVEELPEDVDRRLAQIETSLAAIENRPLVFDPADIARAGAFVSIDRNGSLQVERGFVLPEDDTAEDGEGGQPGSAGTPGRRVRVVAGGASEEDEDAEQPLPDRLVLELTAHRTLALRNAVAEAPRVAVTALLQQLVRETFALGSRGAGVEISARTALFGAQAPDLQGSPAAQAAAARHARWQARAPQDEDAIWFWIEAMSEAERMELLAHCVSLTVNALHERANPYGGTVTADGVRRRLRDAERMSTAVKLDMAAAGWRPTAENYLTRVTKSRILAAVREAKGEAAAQLIDHLKKADMAREAERLLEGTGWLPEPLRLASIEASAAEASLPAFLVEDGAGAAPGA